MAEPIQPEQQAFIEQPSSQQQPSREIIREEDKSENGNCKISKHSPQGVEQSGGKKRARKESEASQRKKLKYKASGSKRAIHGNIYQLKLLMLFFKRAVDKKYSFRLATEMDAAEKFDDVVFRYREGDTETCRLLQAKHKQDGDKKITLNDLLAEEGVFSLQKYFISYRKIRQTPEFNDESNEIKDFVICTNIDLDENLRNSFEPIEGEDDILKFNGKKAERFELKVEKFPEMTNLISILERSSELFKLAKKVADCLIKKTTLTCKWYIPILPWCAGRKSN